MRVVICGAGVIGACTALYLRRLGADVIVVDRVGVAAAASGKAGGFLARDWCTGSPLDALARRSFGLHTQLRDEIGGDWDYRPMNAHSGFVVPDGDPFRTAPSRFGWLNDGVVVAQRIGTPETTAIVHPHKFTTSVMTAALAQGAELRFGRFTGIVRDRDGRTVRGLQVEDSIIEADAVVIAMGPWSLIAARWMSLPVVYGMESPSIVYDTGTQVSADALFLEMNAFQETLSVEVFPRPDGSTYVTAFSDTASLPTDPADVTPELNRLSMLQKIAARLSPLFRPDKIITKQACVRPVIADGLPLIGRVANDEGLYIATGHGPWGILNAPATGETLAQLIAEGATRDVDLAPFDPVRLAPFDSVRLPAQ